MPTSFWPPLHTVVTRNPPFHIDDLESSLDHGIRFILFISISDHSFSPSFFVTVAVIARNCVDRQRGARRKITAIMSADAVEYSRLMGDDETATVRTLSIYKSAMSALIDQHRSIIIDSAGNLQHHNKLSLGSEPLIGHTVKT